MHAAGTRAHRDGPIGHPRIGVGQGLIDAVRGQPGAAAPAPATQPAFGGPPVQPGMVNPFLTPADLQAINDFNTKYATDLANMDFELGNLSADTSYQKTNNDKQAKENTAQAADQMAARGIFQSSIKDAALYDIEASRSLANKFLDDKLTAATLNAGTQKTILGESKKRFDEAMTSQQVQNAAEANAALQSGWADAMAAWAQAHPAPPPVASAPKAPKPPAAGPGNIQPGPAHTVNGTGGGSQGRGSSTGGTPTVLHPHPGLYMRPVPGKK